MLVQQSNGDGTGGAPKPNAERYADEQSRWEAVARRDENAIGKFYLAVRTTGVYCRPGCPARQPKRENVRFFATCEEAEQAGFRPCKRCRPNDASPAERQRDAVAHACRLLENTENALSLADLANAVGMSSSHFHRLFKQVLGLTPKAYAAAMRTQQVREALAQGATVTAALYRAGFHSNSPFYVNATERLGMTPSAFRAGGAGINIRFAVGECSLGSILVAASDRGVCAILLGDDPELLVRDLQDQFPKAQLTGGDEAFDAWVAGAIGLVEHPTQDVDLPLDIRGAAFQVRVWETLRQIPSGSTASYAEIARRIGQPKAARAVARACAANCLAVAIPCHRVVRTDGTLSGYRWGVERKAELLRRERRDTEKGRNGDTESS